MTRLKDMTALRPMKIAEDVLRVPQEGAVTATMTNKEKAIALLKTIETQSLDTGLINAERFIHHTVRKRDGIAGLMDFLLAAPKGTSRATPVRVIQDDDYVCLHTDFDFYGPHIGFDVMRFEDGKVVEMWDCIQARARPNPSGRTMIDGATDIADRDKTEENKRTVRRFVEDVFVNDRPEAIAEYCREHLVQHDPHIADGVVAARVSLEARRAAGSPVTYDTIHKVLGEGNFVLTISEGRVAGQHSALFDLFRVDDGTIVEHWDVIEPIAPKAEWKNTKGRF